MNFCYLKNKFDLFYLLLYLPNTGMGLSNPIKLSGCLKPKSSPVLLRFQHLPPLQFLQQQRFDFFRARLQAAGFFVVFEDFGVGKLRVQIGLFGFQRGDFVGQGVEFALFFVRQLGRAVELGFVFFRQPFGYLMQPESGVSTKWKKQPTLGKPKCSLLFAFR